MVFLLLFPLYTLYNPEVVLFFLLNLPLEVLRVHFEYLGSLMVPSWVFSEGPWSLVSSKAAQCCGWKYRFVHNFIHVAYF